MARSTRDSDEELEAKLGRRYRNLTGATDSPLRRSRRIKQPAAQNESSPDSSLSDNNGGSNIQTRVTRKRTAVMELPVENQRSLRSRKNSVSSDVSEINEDMNASSKKTRNTVVTGSADTPKTRASKRLTRAGSESKSPPIVSKVIGRTRASSMGPENTADQNTPENTRSGATRLSRMLKRRTSVLPSEATVIEENEDKQKILVVELDRTLPSLNESKETGKKSTLTDLMTSRTSLSADKVDASPKNTTDRKMEGQGQKAENSSVELLEDQDKSISNKENQATNVISDAISDRIADSTVSNAVLQSPKSSPASILVADKTVDDKSKSYVTETPLRKPSTDLSKIIISNVLTVKDNVSNIIDAEANTIQDVSSSADNKNTEPSISNASIEESDISLKLETSNGNSSAESPAQSNKAEDKNKSIIHINDAECDINKSNIEKGEPKNSASEGMEISDESPVKGTDEMEDSKGIEMIIVSEEQSSVTEKEDTSNQVVIEQKSSGEDSQKMDISEETKEGDALQRQDSSDTIPCSNLSGLTTFDTSDPLPTNTNETIQNEISCSGKAKALSNASSCINDDSQRPNINVPSSTVESSEKSNESEQNEVEIIEKSVAERISEEKLKDELQHDEQKGKSDDSDKETEKDKEVSSEPNVENLFRDISADEWQEQRQKHTDPEVSSVHSIPIERLDNESEAECDLVLVDRDAWLAAENIKAAKENEIFDYDSDDTVVLKSRLDSSKAQKEKEDLGVVKEESDTDISKDKKSKKENNRRPSQGIQAVAEEVNDTNEEVEKMDVEEISVNKNSNNEAEFSKVEQLDTDTEPNSPVLKLKEKRRLSKSEKLGKGKEESDSNLNKSSLEKSLTERSKSQKKSFEDANNIYTNSEENDSGQEEKFEEIEVKSAKAKDGLNQSVTSNDNTKQAILATPGRKNKEKKILSNSCAKRKVTLKRLNSSESESTSELSSSKCEKVSTKLMQKYSKKNQNRNCSLHTQVGSSVDPSDDNPDSQSDELEIGGRKIPKFLFDDTSSNDSESDGEDSINSDIRREYNLDGENSPKFSDDDVPGDECRASESEYSDPDDNGSDLADFVVDDDEVEDDGEEEDENGDDEMEELEVEDGAIVEEPENDEIEDDKNEEKEEDEDDLHMQIEDTDEEKIEEVGEEVESVKTNKGNGKPEDRDSVHVNKTEAVIPDREDELVEDIEVQESAQEVESNESNDEIAAFQIHNNSKKEKSKTNMSMDSISSEPKRKKKKQKSIGNDANDSKKGNTSMLCLSSGKKKQLQKQQLNENAEEIAEERLNTESPMIYSKKTNKFSQLSDCSTPKISKCETLEMSMNSPNLTLVDPSIKAGSSSNTKLKVTDRSLRLGNVSKKLSKSKDTEQSLLYKSLPTDLTELVEKTNLSRPMSSKVVQLNKSMLTPNTDTPTTKFLKKDKLNDSLPALKFEGGSKKLLRLNLAREKYNASLLASSEAIEECEMVVGETNTALPPTLKEDVLCTDENIEKATLKKKKKNKRAKKANIENIEINAETCDIIPVVTAKRRKRSEKSSTSEIDNIEETEEISEEKKRKKRRKKQMCTVEPELTDEVQRDDICGEESQESAIKLQKKKRKEKRKLKTENTSDICVIESCVEVTKKQKAKNKNDDVLQTRIGKPLTKKQRLQNASPSEIVSTKISKTIEEPTKRKSGESKPFIVTTDTKTRNQILKGVKDVVDSKKASKKIKRNRANEQSEEMEDPIKYKKQKFEFEELSKPNKIKIVKNVKSQQQLRTKIQVLPSRFGFTEESIASVTEDYSLPSLCQGVTNFQVVDLKSITKPKKKATVASTFKQRMLARNCRRPISAYLMYLKKQKACGKDRGSDTSC